MKRYKRCYYRHSRPGFNSYSNVGLGYPVICGYLGMWLPASCIRSTAWWCKIHWWSGHRPWSRVSAPTLKTASSGNPCWTLTGSHPCRPACLYLSICDWLPGPSRYPWWFAPPLRLHWQLTTNWTHFASVSSYPRSNRKLQQVCNISWAVPRIDSDNPAKMARIWIEIQISTVVL